MAQNISVPDIGDFDSVEIIEVLVKVGDQITENDPIVTLESDKSSVEVPSPFSGKIIELNVKIGDKVSKGTLLAKLKNSELDSSGLQKKQEDGPLAEDKIEKKDEIKIILKKLLLVEWHQLMTLMVQLFFFFQKLHHI